MVDSFDCIIKHLFYFDDVMNSNLLFLTALCFIAMVSPGPDFLLVTKNSLLHSQRFALATALGVITGCFFLQSSFIQNFVLKSQQLLSKFFGTLILGLGVSVLLRAD